MNLTKIGSLSYLLALVIFNIFNSIIFLVIPEFKDWELFSFNLYASLILYITPSIIFFLLSFLLKPNKLNKYLVLLILVLFIEIPAFVFIGDSLIKSIVKVITENNENYIMFFYPCSIVIAFCILLVTPKFSNQKE